MKKRTTSRLWSCLFAVLLLGPAFGQSNHQDIAASLASNGRKAATENIHTSAAVNAKVLHAFDQWFQGAQDTYWTTAQSNSVAEFKIGDRRAIALFNKSGRLRHMILTGTAEHLPTFEKQLVRTTYPGYEITTTQEFTVDGAKLWVVMVQNCTDIIRLRVMDNELYELDHFKKL